ncbi:putative stress response protein (Rds1) [Aspergillus thermomutatus]|uniref:Protein rds1 n=1 Tax=Aspergillus thermomutatus TaxID=41047 RepID=A0A397FWT4_ASPTH|nr:uncharacterized protein CDV56_100502 [Aspergillus thermomutatus]RHZ43057.1 hypothetical protein CDV56_100502 [Aspergillus thermomutatus]
MAQSDYDCQSVALCVHQEYIELGLFHYGLEVFSEQDFLDAGLTVEDRRLIEYVAIQEAGHATLLSNMLGESTPRQCTYSYPFKTVREFLNFNVKLTRWGESGTWGWLRHLNSKEVATMVVKAEAIEARQQATFRQLLGLHPMPIWFAPGIPQSWHWTLLVQYISSCPENNIRLVWQNFPNLYVVNQANPNRIDPNSTEAREVVGSRTGDPSDSRIPEAESCTHNNVTGYNCGPAITRDKYDPLTFPGAKSSLPGTSQAVLWGRTTAMSPQRWRVSPRQNQGYTYQPASEVFETDPALNGTAFIAITDTDLFVTPYNLTMLNPHIRALGLYQAG